MPIRTISSTPATRLAAAFLLTAGLSLPVVAQEGAPVEAQPAESQPAETQPVEAQPAETEPAEVAADLPGGFEILQRHVDAIGGSEAGNALEGVRMSGALSMPGLGMSGTITISAAPPAMQLLEITIANAGSMVQGTDGERAWASQPGTPVVMVPEPQAQAMIEGADFSARYAPQERYETATTTGTEMIGDAEVYVVELVSKAGDESVGYFNVETGLQHAEKTRVAPGADAFGNEVTFLDYKEFGEGLMFATKMMMIQQGFAQEITFETVEIDPEFKDGTFDAPGDL